MKYYSNNRSEIQKFAEKYLSGNVLDLGCGAGFFGKNIKNMNSVTKVSGVEQFEPVLPIAAENLDEIVNCNLMDFSNWEALIRDANVVTLLDVLEHIADHKKLLGYIYSKSKIGSYLIISVPNAQNQKIIRKLLSGKFVYEQEGLMDYTHLRWFTKDTLTLDIEASGYEIIEMSHYNYSDSMPTRILKTLFPHFLAKQIVTIAVKK